MPRQIGSQYRELLSETSYKVVKKQGREIVLLDTELNQFEVWFLNNHHAGYTVEINGKGYEFCRSLNANELKERGLV